MSKSERHHELWPFWRLRKAYARNSVYVLRFVFKLKTRVERQQIDNEGSDATGVWRSGTVLLISIQSTSFPQKIEFLKTKGKGSSPDRVRQFVLYFDDDQLIRCKGRLNNSSLIGAEGKSLILLPSKHLVIDLIVRDFAVGLDFAYVNL